MCFRSYVGHVEASDETDCNKAVFVARLIVLLVSVFALKCIVLCSLYSIRYIVMANHTC